jgi:hypothetical protein
MHIHADPLTIPARFNGPPASGNGGYACGVLGALIAECATVRLHRPPPLDTELRAVEDDGDWTLLAGQDLVAYGRADELDLDVPEPPSAEQAVAAERDYVGLHDHIFPTCFVCGPDRELGDGLRLFTGAVDGRGVVACGWRPTDDVGGETSAVDDRVVWGALDCPTYFGGIRGGFPDQAVLGSLTAKLLRSVEVGRLHVVIGWPLEQAQRRWFGGSAIFTDEGELCAFARGIWVRVDRSFPGIPS